METNTSAGKSLHPLIWVAGIAVILLSMAGIGAVMGWIPASKADASDTPVGQALTTTVAPAAAKAPVAHVRHSASAKYSDNSRGTSSDRARYTCSDCGVIESIRTVETKGTGSGLGAVGGGVVGGLLGNQVGGGRGKDVMTVVGVGGGAMAGNEIEKRNKATTSYAITIRLDDGSSRVVNETNQPSWHEGDKVRIVDGAIRSRG